MALGRKEGNEGGAQVSGKSDWVYGRGALKEEGEDWGAGYILFGEVPWDRTPRWIRHGSDPEKPEFTDIKKKKKKPVRVGLSRSNHEMLGFGRMERWGKGCRN